MSEPIRFAWTATGMRPSETQHGATRYISEHEYDRIVAALRKDAERYHFLKRKCIVQNAPTREGPAFQELRFKGKMFHDWRYALDHISLDDAIDDAIARGNP